MKKTLTKGEVQLEVFSGWKDIASYLGKGIRTIQRYEQTLGLPIRRPAAGTLRIRRPVIVQHVTESPGFSAAFL